MNPEELNDAPIKVVNGAVIRIRDVANVRDGHPPETNIVRLDGSRGVLMNVLKIGRASTLDVVNRVKEQLPQIEAAMPSSLTVKPIADQSIFVKAAVSGVVREAVIAAALTGMMILLFLGSLRSTIIITVSIPLAILSSIICLSALGNSINIMTLGGLALAVGILVDDATVTIENINYHLEQGKEITQAILDGAHQIAIPALVSTLAICIVFVPMFALGGVAGYLFVPMAEAVVFAMLASYVLSRTLVPTMANYLLKTHDEAHHDAKGRNIFSRFQQGFEHRFEAVRERYHGLLKGAVDARRIFAPVFLLICVASLGLTFFVGFDFFPSVDAGQIKMHIRGRSGLRVEDTAKLCDQIEEKIHALIPADQLDSITDNIGLPNSGLNLTYTTSGVVGTMDADIQMQLKDGHRPSADFIRELRSKLPADFPSVTFSFLPADITSQILNFGLPSPIDVQVRGYKQQDNLKFLEKIKDQVTNIPGAADVHIQQAFDEPQIDVNVDRVKAMDVGLTQRQVGNNLLIALSGSFQDRADFLGRSQDGRPIQHRDAGATVPAGKPGRFAQHLG